jgi:hypothetical protein
MFLGAWLVAMRLTHQPAPSTPSNAHFRVHQLDTSKDIVRLGLGAVEGGTGRTMLDAEVSSLLKSPEDTLHTELAIAAALAQVELSLSKRLQATHCEVAHALRRTAIRTGLIKPELAERDTIDHVLALQKADPRERLRASLAFVAFSPQEIVVTCAGKASCTVEDHTGATIIDGRIPCENAADIEGMYTPADAVRFERIKMGNDIRRIVLMTHPTEAPGETLELIVNGDWGSLHVVDAAERLKAGAA